MSIVAALALLVGVTLLALAGRADPPLTPLPSFYGNAGGGGGGGGGVAPGTACLLAGGTQCEMEAPGTVYTASGLTVGTLYVDEGVIFPGFDTWTALAPYLLIYDPGTGGAGSPVLDLRSATETPQLLIAIGNAGGPGTAAFPMQITRPARAQFQIGTMNDDDGVNIFGPAKADPGTIGLHDNVDATSGTVDLGAYATRAGASTVPLFCGSIDIEESDALMARQGCFFADGTWQVGNGTAAKPAYSFMSAGNTDNGMYLSAANEISWSTAGTQRAVIDAAGEFGIGLAAPLEELHVSKDQNDATVIRVDNVNAGTLAQTQVSARGATASDYAAMEYYGTGFTPTLTPGNPAPFALADTAVWSSGSATAGGMMFNLNADAQLLRFIAVAAGTYFESVRVGQAGLIGNVDGVTNNDFRWETATNASGIFLDVSAETIDLVGGSGSTGCSIDASGNLTCAGTISGSGSLSGTIAATEVAFGSGVNTIAGDAGMTYVSGTDTMTLGTLTMSTGGTPGGASAIGFTGALDAGLTYSAGGDTMYLQNATGLVGLLSNGNIFLDNDTLSATADILIQAADDIELQTGGTARCTVDGTDLNMTCVGGDAAATPNFAVEAGEGLYDCGANCIALAANAAQVFQADATFTQVMMADSFARVTDTGANGMFTIALDTTSRFVMDLNGHMASDAIGIGTVNTGTCTNEAATADSNDVRGEVETDCTAGQTTIITFGAAYSSTPFCTVSASNAAGGASVVAGTATTTTLTLTIIGVVTDGRYAWTCFQ